MEKIYSKIEPEKLLHFTFSKNDFIEGRIDLTDPIEFAQIAALKHKNKKTFYPHMHIYKDGETKVIVQECWVIINGSVKCLYYDTDGSFICDKTIGTGDLTCTLYGGHNYEVLEDDTMVYEIKQGPYKGLVNDKIKI